MAASDNDDDLLSTSIMTPPTTNCEDDATDVGENNDYTKDNGYDATASSTRGTPRGVTCSSYLHGTVELVSDMTVYIKSLQSDDLITLNEGHIFIAPLGRNKGCAEWKVSERNGRFGFRNRISGTWLGNHYKQDILEASVPQFKCLEEFGHWKRDGGYVLKMWEGWGWFAKEFPIGVVRREGMDKLVLDRDGNSGPQLWQFVQVHEAR